MKVLFFSHQAEFIYGGEVVTLAFMRELRELGVEVHFASPEGPYQERAKEHACCHTVPSVQFSRRLRQVPKILRAMHFAHRALAQIVEREKIDLVHATSLKAMAYCWSIGQGLPVIWHHHDILSSTWSNDLWVRALSFRAARVLCPSNATRQSLLLAGLPDDKVFVLRNGFRLEEWMPRPERRGEAFRVGLVGEISPRKGSDRLEGILEALGEEPAFEFIFIGEGLSDPAFAESLKKKIASPRVRFLGRSSQMKEMYQEIDVLLVPSRQDPLPTVIVEAGLSGVPAVGSRVGGIPEMIIDGENGFLFENESEAAALLKRCRQQWPVLSAGARAIAKKQYDIRLLTNDLIRHYQFLISQK